MKKKLQYKDTKRIRHTDYQTSRLSSGGLRGRGEPLGSENTSLHYTMTFINSNLWRSMGVGVGGRGRGRSIATRAKGQRVGGKNEGKEKRECKDSTWLPSVILSNVPQSRDLKHSRKDLKRIYTIHTQKQTEVQLATE